MRNVQEQMKLLDRRDIVIRPDLNGYTTASFGDHMAIVERGAEAARKMAKQLSAYSVPEAEYQAWKNKLGRPRYPLLDEVRVEGKDGDFTKVSSLQQSLAFPSGPIPVARPADAWPRSSLEASTTSSATAWTASPDATRWW
ncbi:Uncharacterised protein [Chromobacterium violaceum]|uniref:Uncharacterized protein n=1 Tax=Chromobacterium violaceum TaxID=536 RepID=A0A3S4HSE7_CHRVL|nr:Uncharacterised protein [Chromobacterium violaceum]